LSTKKGGDFVFPANRQVSLAKGLNALNMLFKKGPNGFLQPVIVQFLDKDFSS